MSSDKLSSDTLDQMSKVDRSRKTDELSKRILASISQTFSGSEETMNWLKNVNENVPGIPAAGQADQHSVVLTMIGIVDKLFDDFQRYAFQFNQTEPNRDYVISCKRPATGNYKASNERYEGFLQNSAWAMLIQGKPNLIRATFVSPRFLYEDESRRPIIMPFLELNEVGSGVWKLNEQSIQFGHLPVVSKAMFARMIRVTRSEVGEGDALKVAFEAQPTPSAPDPQEVLSSGRDEQLETITNAIINLLDSVDNLLPDLQKEGFVALQKGGMDSLQRVMKQSERVKSIRERAAIIAKDWADIVREY